MYEQHFGLRSHPFSLTLSPDLIYLSTKHKEAMAALFYALTCRKGTMVLTGEVGTGKTTILRLVLDKLSQIYGSRLHFALVINPNLTPDELLESVMLDLGFTEIPTSKVARLTALQEFLLECNRRDHICAIVVDEAQRLSPEAMEEIRLWTNFETAERKLLQVILSGQSELAALLNRTDLRQLKQRVSLRVNLETLKSDDVVAYIETRWTRSGGAAPVPFSADALHSIAHYSAGVPRTINALCDNALLSAFASDRTDVAIGDVEQAANDLDFTRRPPSAERFPTDDVPRESVRSAVAGGSHNRLIDMWAAKVSQRRVADE